MAEENLLPADLVEAARCLEGRFQLLRVPSHKMSEAEWEKIPPQIRGAVPTWIPTLLLNYSLIGGVLEYPDFAQPHERRFRFFWPEDLPVFFAQEHQCYCLLDFGFVPFAGESDGNLWLATVGFGPSGPIYMLDFSGWDGGKPHNRNGLVFATSRLSYLLASMAVSVVSYDDSPVGPTNLIWHPEKPER